MRKIIIDASAAAFVALAQPPLHKGIICTGADLEWRGQARQASVSTTSRQVVSICGSARFCHAVF
jgi:hypothetical protein